MLFLVLALPAAALAGRLDGEASPYLQLHADDPVDWWPWGPAALAEARESNRPILLSIGYLACHWCHVMQEENFRDPDTAAMMNRLFVNVIVDREELPHIDGFYQQAAATMDLQTGWPLHMFLTPDGHPYFGGVYFPPERRQGVPAFREVLAAVAETYDEQPADVAGYAGRVFGALAASGANAGGRQPPSRDELAAAWTAMAAEIDAFEGGFGSAAKYPYVPALETLWRAWLRSGDATYRDAVELTVRAMVEGGIYDHVGGGFMRYAEDPAWSVPHFEKMLNINALMVVLMTDIWRETRAPLLERRIRETTDFMLREMRLPGGLFGSGLDADSPDEAGRRREGAYYVWTAAEIDRIVGDDAALFKRAYGVTAEGNWNGANVLNGRASDAAELAAAFTLPPDAIDGRLAAARAKLFRVRQQRTAPALDDKAVAELNGLAIVALAEAGIAFDRADWLEAAETAFAAARSMLQADGRLFRYARGSERRGPAATADHAQLARAGLVLHEATGDSDFLSAARTYAAMALGHWDDRGGGFHQVAVSAGAGVPPLKPGHDEQAPSGNATMAAVMAHLYFLTGDSAWRERAHATLAAFSTLAKSYPIDHAAMLSAADTLASAVQLVIIGRRGEAETDVLLRAAWEIAVPGRVLQVVAPGTLLPDGHPAQYKEQVDDQTTAYVCVGTFCSLPQTDAAGLVDSVKFIRQTRRGAANPPAE